jgi:hypothetical protein
LRLVPIANADGRECRSMQRQRHHPGSSPTPNPACRIKRRRACSRVRRVSRLSLPHDDSQTIDLQSVASVNGGILAPLRDRVNANLHRHFARIRTIIAEEH